MKRFVKSLFALACAVVMASTIIPASAGATETGTSLGKDGSIAKEIFYAGKVYQHYCVINQSTGKKMSIDSIKSSNTGVATVKLTGDDEFSITTKKAGTTTLTASKNGTKVLEAPITVKSIYTFSTKYPKVKAGKTTDVKVSLATAATVKASSSKTSVCKVSVSSNSSYSSTLKIKGVKKGTANVTVKNTATGEKAVLKVTVGSGSGSSSVMSVSSKSVSVKKGSSATVKATLTKSGTIKASSANTGVCAVKVTKVDSKHAKIKLTGKKAGSTNITVKNTVNSEKITIKVTVKSSSSKTVRRALCISQSYPGTNSVLNCAKYDAPAIAMMAKKTGYSSVKEVSNVSVAQMQAAIKSTFKDADEDDVSLFFYSGHGVQYTGDLCGYNPSVAGGIETVSPDVVASWLKKVPGKVIVILNSCYSGNFIDKDMGDNVEFVTNQKVVSAFATQDEGEKGGPLSSSKFYVLTACNKNQTAVGFNTTDGRGYGLFTACLTDGTGFNFYTGQKYSSAPADKNKDSKLSLTELQKYADPICRERGKHSVQIYPTNSSYTVFHR